MTRFPNPQEDPGAPFADPNFKLVVMQDLLDKTLIDLGASYEELASHVLGRNFDEEKGGYELLKPAYDYLLRYPLTEDHLAAVENLIFDGGNEIYVYAWRFWDGESTEFNVKSLQGVSQLRNLRLFNAIAMLDDTDLGHLAGLDRLETVSLDPQTYIRAETLLSLPSLKTFEGFENSVDADVIGR